MPADAGFDSFWAAINRELAFLHLEMRRVNVPPTPDAALVLYVGIVNKARARCCPLPSAVARCLLRVAAPRTRSGACSDARAANSSQTTSPSWLLDTRRHRSRSSEPSCVALPPLLSRALKRRVRAQIEASADITRAKHGIDGLAVLNLPLFAPSAAGEATQSQEGGAGPSQAAPAGASVKMSVSDRETTLRAMVAEGWLLGDSRSSVRLGPKAFLELGTQLVKASEDEEVQALWQTYV